MSNNESPFDESPKKKRQKSARKKKASSSETPSDESKLDKIGAVHNNFVATFLSKSRYAANFLESNLPVELAEQVDWANLTVESTAFSDEKNRTHYGDLAFSAPFKNRNEDDASTATFFIILEHKSNVERFISLQILKYVVLQAERLVKSDDFKDSRRVPFPIAFVLYNGAKPWRKRRTPRELFYAGKNGERYIPEFEYVALDLAATKPDDLRGDPAVRTFLSLLKSATDGSIQRALTTTLQRFFNTANFVWDATTKDVVRSFLQYVGDVAKNWGFRIGKDEYQQMLKGLRGRSMSEVKTFIDEYREEGLEEGLEKGREKGREEGREEGRGLGLADGTVKTLRRRFGARVSEEIIRQIETINDYPTLEKVFDVAFEADDVEDFQKQLLKILKK